MCAISKVPLVLIKKHFQRSKNKSGGYTFTCCIDGSFKSMETFDAVKKMATKENDVVYAITAFNHDDDQELKDDIFARTAQAAAAREITLKQHLTFPIEESGSIPDTLENFVNFHETIAFDFIMLGGCGMRA